jgi:hypothetical protein
MRLYDDLPELDVAEAERCWIEPDDALRMAGLDTTKNPACRKFWANIVSRGHVPFAKEGKGKTSPRLHSLLASVKARVIWEICRNLHTYEIAAPIADEAVKLATHLIQTVPHRHSIPEYDWPCIYTLDHKGNLGPFKLVRSEEITNDLLNSFGRGYHVNMIQVGEIVRRVIEAYGDLWSADLHRRGIIRPGRYDGCDAEGYPLDPEHPWNKDLPPLERAKRLLEIEEYIERREEHERSETEG